MDYDINPTTGEIDCRFNYDETYKLPATPAFGYDASYGSYLAGGIGLGTVGDCSPYNVMGFNNPGNEDAKEYFTSFANDGSQLNQRSVFGSITGEAYELPAGPIEFVLGFDRRKETARYDADQLLYLV